MFAEQVENEIISAARSAGVEPAALLAVAEVESDGQVFARIGGRNEPLIRFEGHYFHRLLGEEKRDAALHAGLASQHAGGVPNPRAQEGRWKLLNRAAMIDRQAAWRSTSWGIGQVMGDHWEWLGYKSVDALVAEARSGAAGQVALMLRFIEKSGMRDLLNAHDWERFALRYNGPAYERNNYHGKMAAAYRRHACVPARAIAAPLKRGASGAEVVNLQEALTRAGFQVSSDGRFGWATETALRAFQQEAGLTVDGIAGPATFSQLQAMFHLERKSRFSFAHSMMWMPVVSAAHRTTASHGQAGVPLIDALNRLKPDFAERDRP